MSLRVIPGGRGDVALPGLLVVGAAEVVTVAGGPRIGSGQGEIDRRVAADPKARSIRAPAALMARAASGRWRGGSMRRAPWR